uniref:Uncharacterized protein n=1 Tax=Oryza glumipatula TaxID=40148 RepID=A0A0E0AFK4_9ORYZ
MELNEGSNGNAFKKARKGSFPPQKLAIKVRGSPTYILGPLSFHNQCGTIQQSSPSHIGVPQAFTAPLPCIGPIEQAHGPSDIRAPQAPTVHQAFTHCVHQARNVNLSRL